MSRPIRKDPFHQTSLFNQQPKSQGEIGKQRGMEQVEKNADTEWKQAAEQAIYHYARHNHELTVNDMWAGIESLGLTTHETRGAGPVMRRCAKRGWIEKTDRVSKTTRASRNCGDVAIWRSIIYTEAA